MDYVALIHAALIALRYELKVALVIQTLLLWYVDLLGHILYITLRITKSVLKPIESALALWDMIPSVRSGKAGRAVFGTFQSFAKAEAQSFSKEFNMLPLKLQEVELLLFTAFRHIVMATQGSVHAVPASGQNLGKFSKATSKWKQFVNQAEDDEISNYAAERNVRKSHFKRWIPGDAPGKNANCEVSTVNSCRPHISPSPKISEALGDEAANSAKTSALVSVTAGETPAQNGEANAWNFHELKGLWVERKRSRREDVSDKESVRSAAASTKTQQ